MTQKLVILERDTKEELEKAIKKHLEDANFQVKGFSIIRGGYTGEKNWEAWIIIEDYPYMGSD